jgi:hypothetical protein
MVPNACFESLLDAISENDIDEAKYTKEDLISWLNRGGFEPNWSIEQKKHFLSWVP